MTAIPINPASTIRRLKPREMDQAIATWLGWTEVHDIDGALFGRNPDGYYARAPRFSTSPTAQRLALDAVDARGLSVKLQHYLRRVIWFGDGSRQMGNATDAQKCAALVLMISESGGPR